VEGDCCLAPLPREEDMASHHLPAQHALLCPSDAAISSWYNFQSYENQIQLTFNQQVNMGDT